jgi:hypothetical protein
MTFVLRVTRYHTLESRSCSLIDPSLAYLRHCPSIDIGRAALVHCMYVSVNGVAAYAYN